MSGRKQHFIPQSLLRGFGRVSKGTKIQVIVYTYERDIFTAATDGIAAEREFYSELDVKGTGETLVTVEFRDAALTLKVVPQITAAETVIMRVSLENSTPDFSRAAGPAAIPPINTQRAITTLLVNDGQTTVIGGIYTSNQQASTDRTPGLSQIPILSWLFRRDRIDDQSNELLIFITPRIIK